MAVSQSDIDALDASIAIGESLVRKADGSTVQYRSVPDLIRARDDLVARKAAEDAQAAGTQRPRVTKLYHAGRGFD